MKFICTLALGVLCAFECGAQSVNWTEVHALTTRGIHRLYNLEIDQAAQTFDSVSRMAPGDPRGPFFQSVVHFYLYTLSRDQKELTAFLEQSERVIEVCEGLLDQNASDITTKFYLGGIYGYRGLAYHANRSYLRAAQDGRKGYLLLEEAVREKPDLYDAHMGFGLFNYLLAKLPKSMRWILAALGFGGDLEGGLNSLRLAAEKGVYTRTEAKLFLAQFLFAEGRQDTAMRYMNELRAEYPDNTLFLVLYAFWQHRLDHLDEAMTAARTAIEMNERKGIHYGEELAYSTLGSIYFTLNDFSNAGKYYRLYMRMTPNEIRTPNLTSLRAGLACEIAGDRTTARELYGRMRLPDDRPWDTYYWRGQDLLRHPVTEGEILITKGGNEFTRKRYTQSIELYDEALKKTGGREDLQVRALYGIVQAQMELMLPAEAAATAHRLLELDSSGTIGHEAWIIPHTWFKLGQAYARMGRMGSARAAFERVGEFDDYDFQERLEAQVKEAMESLRLAE
jgi:tetratricopeptide (TPR) repeat protein